MGRYAFKDCKSLTRAVLPSTMKAVSYRAFYNCASLTGVSLAEGLKTIDEQAFYNCGKLVDIRLPEGLETVGKQAFYNCANLLRTDFPASVQTIGASAFQNCASLSRVTFQEGLKQIGTSAFQGCSALRSVTLPASVTQDFKSIGEYAFRDSGVSSVSYAGGARAISHRAFYNCDRLTEVDLASTMTAFGYEAFYDCDALEEFTLAPNMTGLGTHAFYSCDKLSSVTFSKGCDEILHGAFEGCVSLKNLRFPSALQVIGENAFKGCVSLWSVSIPVDAGLTSIGNGAFQNCSALKSLDLPFAAAGSSVSAIGSSAFSGCQSLTSVTLRNGPSEIGSSAFSQCYRLKDLTFSGTVIRILNSAFKDCSSLSKVSYYGTGEDWSYLQIGSYNTPLTGASRQYMTGEIPVILVSGVALSETALDLFVGGSHVLTASILPENARDKTVLWSSSAPAVASVDQDGTVRALSEGEAAVTALSPDGVSASCTVTVRAVPVSSVTLNKTALELMEGRSETLMAEVLPENAGDKTVLWTSSAPAVASMDQDGTVHALKAGAASVTATAGGVSAVCRVTVRPIPVSSVTLSEAALNLLTGQSQALTAQVLPENAGDKTVLWTSSNPAVASVDQDGTVHALKAGAASVTARAGGISASCTVTVRDPISASIKDTAPGSTTVQAVPAPGVSIPSRAVVLAPVLSGDGGRFEGAVSGALDASTGKITFQASLTPGDRLFFLEPVTFIPLAKPVILQ